MINYARHDEEFYGIFKLLNGEEVLGKAVLTEDDGESLVFIQEPVSVHIITKEIDEGKMARGIGFLDGCKCLMKIFSSFVKKISQLLLL